MLDRSMLVTTMGLPIMVRPRTARTALLALCHPASMALVSRRGTEARARFGTVRPRPTRLRIRPSSILISSVPFSFVRLRDYCKSKSQPRTGLARLGAPYLIGYNSRLLAILLKTSNRAPKLLNVSSSRRRGPAPPPCPAAATERPSIGFSSPRPVGHPGCC